MNRGIVMAVVLALLTLPDAEADEITGMISRDQMPEAVSKIAATQELLDSFIYDKTVGTITNINLERNTFELEGKTFNASPTDTVGARLSDLMEGDKVTIEATDIETGKQPINVMRLKKAE